ncbi:MAG: hypothetical protein ACYCS1_05285 [Gammaproteobacteria bacterium]
MSKEKIEIYIGDMEEQYEEALELLAKSEGNEFGKKFQELKEAEDKVARWLLTEKYRQIITELAEGESASDFDEKIIEEVNKERIAKRRELMDLGKI